MALASSDTVAMGGDLLEVTERLRAMLPKLDTTTRRCDSCGLRHDRNFRERKAADHLEGAIGRLEKVIEALGASLDESNGG